MKSKKSQTWSSDILVSTLIMFIAIAFFFYMLSIFSSSSNLKGLKSETELITSKLSSSEKGGEITMIVNNKVDEDNVIIVSNMNYTHLKSKLGVRNDFCIFFEDEQGNVINLSKKTGKDSVGIGSPNVNISGFRCG